MLIMFIIVNSYKMYQKKTRNCVCLLTLKNKLMIDTG